MFFWCLQFLPKNEWKQVDLRYHSSKVEFVHSFCGRNFGLKKSLWISLTFRTLFKLLTYIPQILIYYNTKIKSCKKNVMNNDSLVILHQLLSLFPHFVGMRQLMFWFEKISTSMKSSTLLALNKSLFLPLSTPILDSSGVCSSIDKH